MVTAPWAGVERAAVETGGAVLAAYVAEAVVRWVCLLARAAAARVTAGAATVGAAPAAAAMGEVGRAVVAKVV